MSSKTTSQNTISIATLATQKGLVVNLNCLADPGDSGYIVNAVPGVLFLDHDYQRELNTPHALKIGQNFKFVNMKIPSGFINSAGEILITDGQHTCVGAHLAKIPSIPVYVQRMPDNITSEQAIAMQSKQFIEINRSAKPVSKFDMYRNLLIQKDEDTMAMAAACARAGVVPCNKSPAAKRQAGAMSHISNLTNAWTQIGHNPTEESLTFLRSRFPHCPIDARLFYGLARFIQKFAGAKARNLPGANYDLDVLYDALTVSGALTQMVDVSVYVDNESVHTSKNTNTTLDVWVAKTIRYLYNNHVGGQVLADGTPNPKALKALI